jgi:hypothetical protein
MAKHKQLTWTGIFRLCIRRRSATAAFAEKPCFHFASRQCSRSSASWARALTAVHRHLPVGWMGRGMNAGRTCSRHWSHAGRARSAFVSFPHSAIMARTRLRSATAAFEEKACFDFARRHRSCPAAVLGLVDSLTGVRVRISSQPGRDVQFCWVTTWAVRPRWVRPAELPPEMARHWRIPRMHPRSFKSSL